MYPAGAECIYCTGCLVLLGVYVVVAALADAHGAQRAQTAHGRFVARAAAAEHRAALPAVVPPLQRSESNLKT